MTPWDQECPTKIRSVEKASREALMALDSLEEENRTIQRELFNSLVEPSSFAGEGGILYSFDR
jgi:hypothetical protein